MERREILTPLGPIWLWGAAEAFEGQRPLVVAIAGAFAIPFGPLFRPAPALAEVCDVVTGHLPGNHCPPLIAASIGIYSAAYSQAIDQAFPGRPVVGCGASIGGLVALGLRSPAVRRLVVMEPPLRTAKLWCMIPFMQKKLRDNPQDAVLRDFIHGVFGVSEDSVEDRNYQPLIDGLSIPTRVILGEEPLYPEREIPRLPSLVDVPERELMGRHPLISTTLVQGVGHNIPDHAADVLTSKLRDAVALSA